MRIKSHKKLTLLENQQTILTERWRISSTLTTQVMSCPNCRFMILTEKNLSDFKTQLLLEERSRHTISKYVGDVNQMLLYMDGKDIGKAEVLEYKMYLHDHYKTSSVNSKIAAINQFFLHLGHADFCLKPLKMQRNLFSDEDLELTAEEYFSMVECAKQHGRERTAMIMQSLCATGIRVSELSAFTLENIQSGKILVENKGKIRVVYLPESLQEILLQYASNNNIQSGSIFYTRYGNSISRQYIWREIKRTANEVGINPRKVFPHNFRKLFARTFYDQNQDIVKLADVLGHSNINTTRIYTTSSGKEHQKILDEMNLVVKK